MAASLKGYASNANDIPDLSKGKRLLGTGGSQKTARKKGGADGPMPSAPRLAAEEEEAASRKILKLYDGDVP
ncbi:MAG TPA: hypothetical protein VHX86_05870 [Tepidisphaeraceae bacterium]|jgi:hypothetical protein|nr:hypothetical protein [Tepidisphaeraceae bacterium]